MSERVTNEQALAVKNMINGRPFIYAAGNDIPSDWFAADLLDARAQRDTAWQELREIREAIKADESESTADEVRSLVAQRDELRAALKQLADETSVDTDCVFDPKPSFLKAHENARIVLEKYKEASHVD